MAKGVSNAHLYLSAVGAADPTPIVVTSITNAKPAVLTLGAAAPAGTANGDIVMLEGTGEPKLDGYAFKIAALNTSTPGAPTMELLDFDGTKLTAAVATGSATIFNKAGTAALLHGCVASVVVTDVEPDQINMDDMCGTAVALGSPKPPTFNFSGFVDKESEGFRNLSRAAHENPKKDHWLLIDYTDLHGYIFGPAQIGAMTVTATVNQGLQFSGTGTFTEVPTYSWDL